MAVIQGMICCPCIGSVYFQRFFISQIFAIFTSRTRPPAASHWTKAVQGFMEQLCYTVGIKNALRCLSVYMDTDTVAQRKGNAGYTVTIF